MMDREWNHPPILARIADGVVKGGLTPNPRYKRRQKLSLFVKATATAYRIDSAALWKY